MKRNAPERYSVRTPKLLKQLADKYAWPGGYPVYGVMADGEALCSGCGTEEAKLILKADDDDDTQWQLLDVEVNWEDENLRCANCNKLIESAYGEGEVRSNPSKIEQLASIYADRDNRTPPKKTPRKNRTRKNPGAYNFTVELVDGKWRTYVDPARHYGYFEHDDEGEGGGLWFEQHGRSMRLVDADGTMMLPKAVARALRLAGVIVPKEFD